MQLPILKNTSCSLLQRKESWMEMKAEIVAMTAEAIDKEAIARGGEILKRGGLVAFPTETVYGLGGNSLKTSYRLWAMVSSAALLPMHFTIPSGYWEMVSSVAMIPD